MYNYVDREHKAAKSIFNQYVRGKPRRPTYRSRRGKYRRPR